MTAHIDLPGDGKIAFGQFEALPRAVRGWAWELRSGRLMLTHRPVTGWHWLVVLAALEYWRDRGHAILGEQYAAESGFVRGGSGKNNVVADGVVFIADHEPDPALSTHDASDIHAAIEAVSADGDSEERDCAEKRDIYAALGIPHYWIIRNEAAGSGRDGMITMYELSGDGYRLVGHRLVSQLKNA